jgi:hypothetical protein
MLDVLDQGIEVRAGIRAEPDHEVVERPEGRRASVGDAATVDPNAESGLLQLAGKRAVLSVMQAVLERRGFERYNRALTLLKRRFVPNPRGPQLGRFDAAVLAQTAAGAFSFLSPGDLGQVAPARPNPQVWRDTRAFAKCGAGTPS